MGWFSSAQSDCKTSFATNPISWIITILVLVVGVASVAASIPRPFCLDTNLLSQIGDFVSGLFSFLAFVWMITAYRSSQKDAKDALERHTTAIDSLRDLAIVARADLQILRVRATPEFAVILSNINNLESVWRCRCEVRLIGAADSATITAFQSGGSVAFTPNVPIEVSKARPALLECTITWHGKNDDAATTLEVKDYLGYMHELEAHFSRIASAVTFSRKS